MDADAVGCAVMFCLAASLLFSFLQYFLLISFAEWSGKGKERNHHFNHDKRNGADDSQSQTKRKNEKTVPKDACAVDQPGVAIEYSSKTRN